MRLMKPQVRQTNKSSVAAWDVWTAGSKNKCDAHFGAWVHKAWRARSCKGKGLGAGPKRVFGTGVRGQKSCQGHLFLDESEKKLHIWWHMASSAALA